MLPEAMTRKPLAASGASAWPELVGLRRAAPALDRERDDRHVGVREHQAQRYPGAVVEAAFGIFLHRQAGGLDGGDDFLGRFAAAGGRVVQAVEFFRKTPEVVNGFRAVGKTHGRHGRIPVRADDHDGARRGQGFRQPDQRRTGRARTQGESRCAVRDEEGGLGLCHVNDSGCDGRTLVLLFDAK